MLPPETEAQSLEIQEPNSLSTQLPESSPNVSSQDPIVSSLAEAEESNMYMTQYVSPGEQREFGEQCMLAKKEAVEGLRDKMVFKEVKKVNVGKDANILGGRFVFCIKDNGTSRER